MKTVLFPAIQLEVTPANGAQNPTIAVHQVGLPTVRACARPKVSHAVRLRHCSHRNVAHTCQGGSMFKRIIMLGTAALFAAGCGTDRPHPTDATLVSTTLNPNGSAAFSAVKFWEAGATVRWNQLATDLATAAPAPGINAIRLYTYLSLAQLRAAQAAQAAPGPPPPIAAAIGGASVAVLSSFFPSGVAQLEAALDAQQTAD